MSRSMVKILTLCLACGAMGIALTAKSQLPAGPSGTLPIPRQDATNPVSDVKRSGQGIMKMDSDQDCKISQEEFMEAGKMRDKKQFQVLDKNKDGFIDAQEASSSMTKPAFPGVTSPQAPSFPQIK